MRQENVEINPMIFILGIEPLLVGGLLDVLGIIDIGNGLGLGLLFFASFWPSIILIIIGAIVTKIKESMMKGVLD